jgi:HD-GYP domain-containing protein (c-di-GMP phosphodiesterase class II)
MLELVALLSHHDRLTRGHCERVRAYTDLIIDEIGLPEDDAKKLRWAALLHDVGNLLVPFEILDKQGRPTEDEWDSVKSHAWQGQRLVKPLRGWLGEWALAVGQHHEPWDGGGYPVGLAGVKIHLGARIVSVADTYDVMTSARSYKDPLPAHVAGEEIARHAGAVRPRDCQSVLERWLTTDTMENRVPRLAFELVRRPRQLSGHCC